MFACTLNKIDTQHSIPLGLSDYSASIYGKISDITTAWNQFASGNLFLHTSFLSALEEAPPSRTQYRYVLISKDDKTAGIIYFQIKKIDLYKSLRLDAYKPKNPMDAVWHTTKSALAKPLKAHVLVSGNMTLTGNNSYVFDDTIPATEQAEIVQRTIDIMIEILKKECIFVKAVLAKDYYKTDPVQLDDASFTKFQVQPNMKMTIPDHWTSFDDYTADMRSKYRIRVRRARKKSESLYKRKLSLDEIHAYESDINRLYLNVAEQANFNLFILPPNYFYSLQKHLGANMNIIAYFDDTKMVGFYTNIKNHQDLDAHFLGYDPDCNTNCQLYLNMLYDLVDDAIHLEAKNLILSRTAMEIKSSIGAEGHDMFLYLKATNKLLNKGVAKGLAYFTPTVHWEPRSPFK